MKSLHHNRILVTLFSTALLAGTALPASAAVQQVRVDGHGFLAANQSSVTSQHLEQIMSDVASARSDLQKKQPTQAKESLLQAQTTLKAMMNKYGAGVASLYISSEHKAVNASSMDAQHELNMHSLRSLDRAKADLSQGNFTAAAKTVDTLYYPLAFASIDIPMAQTLNKIENAVSMIDKGKPDKAVTTLDMVRDATQTSSGVFGGEYNKG